MTTAAATGSNLSGNQAPSSKFALKTEDFIKLMITQLQNQDPLEPAKNEQLLAQMSQIGQLESSQQLQSSLKSMVLQNNVGAASGLIGKTVSGQLSNGEKVSGVVNSVKVENDSVTLELDNGHTVELGRVTSIAPTPIATTVG
ncbi:MAG TPA: flagellar hook capping FlgD N-terminal domain-containing protein [Tepidisphaeraceae bacterium]|nr:flagellar hook capping FlgD N-terminal domain-containing protein [Tepidisphaeraceae bacterium]